MPLVEERRSSTARGTMLRRGRWVPGLGPAAATGEGCFSDGETAALAKACAAGMSPQPASPQCRRATLGDSATQLRPRPAAAGAASLPQAGESAHDPASSGTAAAAAELELDAQPSSAPTTPAPSVIFGLRGPLAPLPASTSRTRVATAPWPYAWTVRRCADRSSLRQNTALQSGTRQRSCRGRQSAREGGRGRECGVL